MPVGTRVIYPRPPLAPLKDVEAAIRYAIHHPYGTEPLYAKLKVKTEGRDIYLENEELAGGVDMPHCGNAVSRAVER